MNHNRFKVIMWWLAILLSTIGRAADWPMLGRDATRNAVSPETGSPLDWDVGKLDPTSGKRLGTRNVRWAMPLGSQTFGDPVVADEQVWVGTNDFGPHNSDNVDASALLGFDIRTGKLLHRYISPRLAQGRVHDWPSSALACSPLVDGDSMWFTTNRGETVCLDIGPLSRGDGEPHVLWKVDMMKQLGVLPCGSRMTLCHTCSIASHKDFIYVITGNGVDDSWSRILAPEAPSLVCFNKRNGEVVWQDNSPGSNVISGQWASPLVVDVNGQTQVIAPQGDGWLRAFDALTGKLIWKFDINPKTSQWALAGRGTRNNILATPVYSAGRIYVASGEHAEFGEGLGRLVCIDPTKQGDVSSELAVDADGNAIPHRRVQVVDLGKGEKSVVNPNSALIWEYKGTDRNGDGKLDFEEEFHRTHGNVVIKDALLLVADWSGLVHCLDVKTGTAHWTHDCLAAIYASPLVVEDKAYIADEDGDVAILRLTAETSAPIAEINMETAVFTSPVFSGGTLYIATRNWLYAIAAAPAAQQVNTSIDSRGHWPQWRGPKRENRSVETGLLKEWPENGPPLVWRVEGIGSGIASVSVAGGRIYTLGYHEGSEYVLALDEGNAERVWQQPIGPEVRMSALMRWLSQRAPTVDQERLYAVTADGDCVCLSASDGNERWRVSYLEEFDARRPTWGFCDYPLVDGDRLICTPGGEKASIVALDKSTGKVIWTSFVSDGGQSAYGSMMPAEIGGVQQYIVFLSKGLVGVRASDGKPLWRYDKNTSRIANSYTPIIQNDLIYSGNGYGTNFAALKLIPHGETFDVQEVYSQQSTLDAFQDSTVMVGNHLFTFRSGGLPLCIDVRTGKTDWGPVRVAGRGKAAITYADERLYFRHSDGRMTLVEPSHLSYVERGSFSIPDHAESIGSTFPVIAGGRLYLRDDTRLFCYDIRAQQSMAQREAPRTIQLAPPPKATDAASIQARNEWNRTVRSVFVPTPHDVVAKMLALADVKKSDVVYDLGSGDGRIVITAAKEYGCRAVGYELDKTLFRQSIAEIRRNGVRSLVTIEDKDLFTANLDEASVVTLYLLPKQLEKLVPQLAKLKPGSRIVSHQFAIPGVEAGELTTIESKDDGDMHRIFLWKAPLRQSTDEPNK